MDIFSWSLPFVAEKVTEMLFSLIKPASEMEEDEDDDEEEDVDEKIPGMHKLVHNKNQPATELKKRGDILRNKVKFVSKMMKMNKSLREQNETIVRSVVSDTKIPSGLLSQKGTIKDPSGAFSQARKADIANEMRPVI